MSERGPEDASDADASAREGWLRRWTAPRAYPTIVLLLLFGLVAALLAWLSVGLLSIAMSNFDFLRRHGLMAVAEGGLVQTAWIVVQSVAVLMLYLGFRGIEVELISRWVHRGED